MRSLLLSIFASMQVWAFEPVVDESCLRRDPNLVGTREGTLIDDMEQLEEFFTSDTRMWGFQYCLDETETYMTSFRVKNAHDYGTSEFIDMTPIGPGTTNCQRLQLSDSYNEPV